MHRFIFWIFIIYCQAGFAQLPAGFSDQLFTDEVVSPVGIEFVDTHLIYVWEQDGIIEVFENGQKSITPLLNLQEEVSGTADHGMLGLALHPDFNRNGFLFLSYVVDPHYLLYFGTPDYDTDKLQTWNATIARVTRYQVDTTTFRTIVPGSRKVLIGDTIINGIPVLAPAHGIGGLAFGTDGTLLVGTGDGTTWVGNHTGGDDYKEFGFDSLGKALGIIRDQEDFGSLRSQIVQSYSGKILRIDPISGLGLPSNPFYDERQPGAASSKVWALGLRSPFRIRVKPRSGSANAADGKPGIIVVGDVGSNKFEEINVIDGPGQNLGWPLYEGMVINHGYYNQWIENPWVVNKLVSAECDFPFLHFNELLVPEREDHLTNVKHPCDSNTILSDQVTFVHRQPVLSYGNSVNNPLTVHLPGFNQNGVATHYPLDELVPAFLGENFDGISSVAGDFYIGTIFPESYQNSYFHGDFKGWIKNIKFSDASLTKVIGVDSFLTDGHSVVYLKFNPFDQYLYYVVLDYSDRPNLYQIRYISYGENARPVARIMVDTTYGYSPLTVSVSAVESYDPQGEKLTYDWHFNGVEAGHFQDSTFTIVSTDPSPMNFKLSLLTTDEVGQIDSINQFISLNNTPPRVNITSLEEHGTYLPGKNLLPINLEAEISDAEHETDLLHNEWEIKLRHNDHFHVEFSDTLAFTETQLVPLSSTIFDQHSYVISLTVTDPLGLAGSDEVTLTPDLSTRVQENNSSKIYLRLNPNPAANLAYLQIENLELNKNYNLGFYDLLGRCSKHLKLYPTSEQAIEISLEDLAAGLYIVTLADSQQIIGQTKLIVE